MYFLKPKKDDLNLRRLPDTFPNVRARHHKIYSDFLNEKETSELQFIYMNRRFSAPLSYHSNYIVNPEYTVGTIRNYDPIKKYYILASYKHPDRPCFVPQEALTVTNDYMIPNTVPQKVHKFFPNTLPFLLKPLDSYEQT